MKNDTTNPYPKGSPERAAYASAKRSEAMRRRWATNPEYREKMIALSNSQTFTEEDRARRSANLRKQWADPAFREIALEQVRRRASDPGVRANASLRAKAQYEAEKALGVGMHAPDAVKRHRAKCRAILKAAADRLYAMPEWLALLNATIERLGGYMPDVFRDPEVRAFHAEHMARFIPEAAEQLRG